MNIAIDPQVNSRLRVFLTRHVARHPRTDAAYIRRAARAVVEDGHEVRMPEGAVEAMLAFEDRFGGLSYAVPGWPNEMEYGLDGDVSLYETPLGWAFYGVLDGSQTAPLDVLLDGRVTACLGTWSQRVLDDSAEQRLNKHALLLEVASMPSAVFSQIVPTGEPAVGAGLGLPAVVEASGGGDRWWRDNRRAVWCHLDAWPADGTDHWTVTCFATTQREADHLAEDLRRTGGTG